MGQLLLKPSQVSAGSQVESVPAGPHWKPAPRLPSLGQFAELPVQDSATSHTPAAGRHTLLALRKVSAGQEAEPPLQFSAWSHTPADGRQTVDDDLKVLGHAAELPVQVSA